MSCHFLPQGSNLGLLHCRQTLYCLSHQEGRTIQDMNVFGILSRVLISFLAERLLQESLLGIYVHERYRRLLIQSHPQKASKHTVEEDQ